ncbi:MAG: DUF4157 domain-containing protein [Deltaproteobacteria bacterium]|nr:DUF4157 domain-containing protein [Deltaproteobacteria bacterium]
MRIQRWSTESEAPIANDNQETTYVGRRTLVEGQVRRKGSGPAGDDAATLVQRAQGSGGVELPEGLRGRFERSLGADLGGVRVHTGAASADAAARGGARAYALGQDVHFGAGEYTPGTSGGDQLIAHEVAHTVQQGGSAGAGAGPQFALEVSQPGDAFETEADRAAASMVTGAPAEVSRGSAGVSRAVIQRAVPVENSIRGHVESAPAKAGGAGGWKMPEPLISRIKLPGFVATLGTAELALACPLGSFKADSEGNFDIGIKAGPGSIGTDGEKVEVGVGVGPVSGSVDSDGKVSGSAELGPFTLSGDSNGVASVAVSGVKFTYDSATGQISTEFTPEFKFGPLAMAPALTDKGFQVTFSAELELAEGWSVSVSQVVDFAKTFTQDQVEDFLVDNLFDPLVEILTGGPSFDDLLRSLRGY